MSIASVSRLSSRVLLVAALAGLFAYAASCLLGPQHVVVWRDAWIYDSTILAIAVSAVMYTRTIPASERHGRGIMTFALLSWTMGDVCWELYRHLIGPVPTPSIMDVLYLGMYPLMFIGLLVFLLPRLRTADLSLRADGVIVGLGTAAIYSLLMEPVARRATGGVAAIITQMAYPIADLLLAAVVLAFLASLGWRFDRFTGTIALGCLLFCVADSHYLLSSAAGTYREGTLFDAGWVAGLLLWSFAIRQDHHRLAISRHDEHDTLSILLQPLSFVVTVVTVLVVAEASHVSDHLMAFVIAMIAVLLRAVIMMRNLQQEKAARGASAIDKLTSLPNRQGLVENIRDVITTDQRDACALVLIGLSNLREITNAFGHEVGDQIVVAVAKRLSALLPNAAYLARLREDEFAIVQPVKNAASSGLSLAHEVLATFTEPILVGDIAINARAKIGIAQYPDHARNELDLLRLANDAMLYAVSVDTSIELSDIDRTDIGRKRILLTEELRKALTTEELTCYYQPQVEITTGRIVGVEALLRWEHPVRGLIPPGDFLDIARETGQLAALSRRVLNVVVAQCAAWEKTGITLPISMNLTVTDLLDAGLVPYVSALLARYECQASSIVIEITEETVMHDRNQVLNALLALHDLGFGLSIDDYGSGYSSLANLHNIPATELKIDGMFVTGLADDTNNQLIVGATVGLAHGLGLTVVGECVETLADVAMLRALGCDLAQGFYYTPALPADAFAAWFSEYSLALFLPRGPLPVEQEAS
jgi:diguanylate cyclase (GGDEF)-like protein